MLIECGNGGDWEFEQDRIFWVTWITLNMKTTKFKVFSKAGIPAHMAVISFADPRDLTMFALIAPKYAPRFTSEEMESVFKGRDAMQINR